MKYVISRATLAIIFLGAMLAFGFYFSHPLTPHASASVELGITELSPRGEAGGWAMPASGASVELSYRQQGESTWQTASPGILPDDDPVDLRWESISGTSDMNECTFTGGYKVPSGVQAISDTSLGSSVSRILSDVGNASTFTISCTDYHEESGHNGNPYSDQDTVYLMLETECNDNADNDGDGLIDEDDPGCHTDGDPNDGDNTYDPLDDDEDDTSPSMTLQACDDDGVCADAGETLIIDELDEVEVIWTSQNTDFCDSVGTFNMTGNPTSGSDDVSEPDLGETVDFIVACGNSGVPQIARSVAVRLPAIRLIPYPNPPIVPSTGMPVGDPATVEPQYEGYIAALCTLTGKGVNGGSSSGTRTIQELIDDGDLTGGVYEVDLNTQGETTYILECQADSDGDGIGDGDPVQDTATFRILPVIEET